MTEFTVLGVGADPRIYGSEPVSSAAAEQAAMQYILTCRATSPSSYIPWEFVAELILEGGAELFVELIGVLLSCFLHLQ